MVYFKRKNQTKLFSALDLQYRWHHHHHHPYHHHHHLILARLSHDDSRSHSSLTTPSSHRRVAFQTWAFLLQSPFSDRLFWQAEAQSCHPALPGAGHTPAMAGLEQPLEHGLSPAWLTTAYEAKVQKGERETSKLQSSSLEWLLTAWKQDITGLWCNYSIKAWILTGSLEATAATFQIFYSWVVGQRWQIHINQKYLMKAVLYLPNQSLSFPQRPICNDSLEWDVHTGVLHPACR